MGPSLAAVARGRNSRDGRVVASLAGHQRARHEELCEGNGLIYLSPRSHVGGGDDGVLLLTCIVTVLLISAASG